MKKHFFKRFLIALIIVFFIILISVFSMWQFVVHNMVKEISKRSIIERINKLPHTQLKYLGEIRVEKEFPYLIVKISKINVDWNSSSLDASQVSDKISVFQFIYTHFFTKKTYLGTFEMETLNIKSQAAHITKNTISKHINQKTLKAKSINPFIVPILPFDLHVKNASIKTISKYGIYIYKGTISLKYHPILIKNDLKLKGYINGNPINAVFYIRQKYINANFETSLQNTLFYGIKSIDGHIEIFNLKNIRLSLNINEFKYGNLKAKAIRINSEILLNGNTLKIQNFALFSQNGFNVSLHGTFNIQKPLNSTFYGVLSTPYLKIGKSIINKIPIKNLNKHISFIIMKLKQVYFNGKINANFITNGNIIVKSAKVRLKKYSGWINVKNSSIKINKHNIIAHIEGNLSSINFYHSSITIHRGGKYLCDMHFEFNGIADKKAGAFLKHNIFSRNDIRILEEPRNLKGKFSGSIDVKEYEWNPKPFFNFYVSIAANGVSFVDDAIPGGFIKAYGNIIIERKTENGQIKSFIVKLTNMKIEGIHSNIFTVNTTFSMFPHISFATEFSGMLTKNDTAFIEKEITRKSILLPQNNMDVNAYIVGTPENLDFRGNIKTFYTFNRSQNLINLTFNGSLNKNILSIADISLKIKNNMNLNLKDVVVNVKNFSYSLKLSTNKFSIHSLSSVLSKKYYKLIPLKSGIITVNVTLTGIKSSINSIKGKMYLQNGNIGNYVNNINMNVTFNNKEIDVKKCSLYILHNYATYTGIITLSKPYIITGEIKSSNMNLNLNTLFSKHKKVQKTTMDNKKQPEKSKKSIFNPSIYIPQDVETNMNIDVANFHILYKKLNAHLKNLHINVFKHGIHAHIKISSNLTNGYIDMNRDGKTTNINAYIKDYAIFSSITGYIKNNNLLVCSLKLHTSDKDNIFLRDLSGNVNIKVKNGRFLGVPSVYKILSATNILEIMLGQLDFASKGLEYKKITVEFKLKNGVLKTQKNKPLIIDGKDISIFATGLYNITTNYIDMDATFTTFRTINRIISSIPIVGWIIGGKEKSFTGLSFNIKGNLNGKLSIAPIPIQSMGKGVLDIIKRTFTFPLHIF